MPKAPKKEVSSTPFPFVRQFTAPPFFVDIEDAKRKSQLLLDAVQHPTPAKPKAGKKKRAPVVAAKRTAKKSKTGKKR